MPDGKPRHVDEANQATGEKSLEFLLFSGDYESVLARQLITSGMHPAAVGAFALSGRLDEAQSALRALIDESAESADVPQARFYLIAGFCHAGQAQKGLRLVRESLGDLAETDPRVRFWIWQGLALVRFFEGRFGLARAAGRRALASATQARFPYARVLALDLLAQAFVLTGHVHAGLRMLEQAVSLADALGYAQNSVTLRTSALVYRMQYLLGPLAETTQAVVEAVSNPDVSYFARRNALIELASSWAIQGRSDLARAALDDARAIALPGSDRRARTRWLGALALVTAVSEGQEPAREVMLEALAEAGSQVTLLAELAFVEALFLGASNELKGDLPRLERTTGMSRAVFAAAHALGRELPNTRQAGDGLCKLLADCLRAESQRRASLLIEHGLFGLVPWALGRPPAQSLILTDEHLLTENRGRVSIHPAPKGPSLKVLQLLGTGFQSREQLAQQVWGLGRYHPDRHAAVINTALSRLRASLEQPGWLVTHEDGYHLASGVDLLNLEQPSESKPANSPPPPLEEHRLLGVLGSGPATSTEVARQLQLSPSSVLRLLRRLAERGVVIRQGSGRNTRYALAASAGEPRC